MAYDSVVIGGGVMGSSIALRLAQAGLRVLVLEKAVPGAEASSAAGGILGAQIEDGGDPTLLRLCLASRDAYPDLAEELAALAGIDIAYRKCGLLLVAMEGEDRRPLEERRERQLRLGLRVEALERDELLRREPRLSPDASAGLYFPDEAQVDPKALASALALAAARVGATYRTATVRGVAVEGGKAVGVDLDDERIAAGAVVVAAGAWTSHVPGTGLPADAIQPLRGQMLRLRTEASLRQVIFARGGYLVPGADGEIVAGSTMERVGFEKRATAAGIHGILSLAMGTLPELAGAELVATWSGLRPCPSDGLPLIGKGHAEGLYLASGHHRNGILLTPQTARLVATCVLEGKEPEELSPFSPRRFAPEPAALSA